MNPTTSHPDAERIEEEAALWAARLRGAGMTDADRARLATWLDVDPEHRWVLSRYRELSAELDEQMGGEAAGTTARAKRRRIWAGVGLAAAAIAVLIAFVGRGRHDFATAIAERHVAALSDGSHVELNAGSELKVRFREDERRVQLVRGEAMFSVAKDPSRPFVVETAGGTVRVTGTVFNVRTAADTRVEITVLEGHVRVRPADAAATATAALTRFDQAWLTPQQVAVHPLEPNAAQDVVAWRRGQVVFVDTPLRDAMARFAAYHTCTITVAADVADQRLGGVYNLDDLDGVLEALERALPVRVERGTAGAVSIVAQHAP